MRHATRITLMAAAIAAMSLVPNSISLGQVAPSKPTTQPAAAREQQGVPVKEVVLFTSGVGYFEHFGTVTGNANTELSFKTTQINDILKSLLLEDTDGGKISVVTYGSQEPLARTLKSFEIDLSTNPSLSQILGQLRGTSVTATLADAKVNGTILGVEKKQRAVADNKLMDVWVLDLLLPSGSIRPIELDRVDEV